MHDKFDEIDNRHAKFVKEMQNTNDQIYNRISKNDLEIENIHITISEIKEDLEDRKA
jgi:uridine kinase